jgi:hypothetical protein
VQRPELGDERMNSKIDDFNPSDWYAPIRKEFERTKPMRDECERLYEEMKSKGFEPFYKELHLIYALFSFNKDLFGFVHHEWFPCGSWEAPKAEWDYDYKKGFRAFDWEYKTEVCDEEFGHAKFCRDNGFSDCDWKWILNVKCVPVGFKFWRKIESAPDLYYFSKEKNIKIKWRKIKIYYV